MLGPSTPKFYELLKQELGPVLSLVVVVITEKNANIKIHNHALSRTHSHTKNSITESYLSTIMCNINKMFPHMMLFNTIHTDVDG